MPRTLAVPFAVALALALAGCPEEEKEEDGPHPLTGIYAVTAHTEASPCDEPDAPAAAPITRFKLAETEFFFADVLGFFDCSETLDPAAEELDEDGCSTASMLQFTGMPPDDSVQITSCACADATCTVSGTDGGWQETADGAALTVERRVGEVPNADPESNDCDPVELFEAHADDLACEERTHIAGARE